MKVVILAERFGALDINNDNLVSCFQEQPKGDGSWINAGFFVCEPKVLDYIENEFSKYLYKK
jgi:glucose-1-phosphate cytidylyltransferase